jgi:adenylyltransferase/sulfurtransferase
MYGQKDIGKYKAHAAKKELLRINPHANITIITRELNSKSLSLLKQDLVLDCTDNLETRFWINEYCHKNKIPWIYASAIRWEGYVMLISPHGPCLSCFIKSDVNHNYVNKTCTQQGIISPLPASIATLQTSLALRYLIGEKIEPLLYHLNLHTLSLSQLKVKKKNNCPTCSKVR